MENQPHVVGASGSAAVPAPAAGPWRFFKARVLLPVILGFIVLVAATVHILTGLVAPHKETPQDVARRNVAQQYDGQGLPVPPAQVNDFTDQTKKDAAAKALNDLGERGKRALIAFDQPPNNPANPLAVPGNPANTDPAVYKAWVDADAQVRMGTMLTSYSNGGTGSPLFGGGAAAGGGSSGASGPQAPSPAEEARKAAKEREQKRLAAASTAVDFTASSTGSGSAPIEPQSQLKAPPVIDPPVPATAQESEKTEPIAVKMHRCTDLCEGDLLPGVLTNRLTGSQAGFADVMITDPVFSHTWDPEGRRLLIPVGSRVLGNVTAIRSNQEERLFVAFHKVRRPDGSTFSLDNFTGLDMAGQAGLRDLVNHHYVSTFGVAGAIAAIGAVAQVGNSQGGFGYDPAVAIRTGISQEMGQESMQILDRFLSRPPTMTVREGKNLVKIYISQDLTVPAYQPQEAYVSQR